MRTTRTIAAGSCAAALALAGCGGSSSSSSGLSQSQIASKLNSICTSNRAAVATIKTPADFATNPVSAANYLDQLKTHAFASLSMVQGLKPNASTKPAFNTFVSAVRHQLGLLVAAEVMARAKNPAGLRDLQAAAAYKRQVVNPAATALGATECAK
jgi:hypothetical protein